MKIKTLKNKLPIYTDRLKIQILGSRDVDTYISEVKQPYFSEYLEGKNIASLSDFEIANRLRSLVQYYGTAQQIVYEIRLVIKDNDNNFIGGITLCPRFNTRELEIGYWVVPKYQGNGYATEALNRVCIFSSIVFKSNIDKLVLYIQERNIKSLNVAKNCNFEFTEYIPGNRGRNIKCTRSIQTD